MIDIILNFIYRIVNWIINLFPVYQNDFPTFESVAQIKGYAFMFDSFLPVTSLFVFLGIILSIEAIYFVYRGAIRIKLLIKK